MGRAAVGIMGGAVAVVQAGVQPGAAAAVVVVARPSRARAAIRVVRRLAFSPGAAESISALGRQDARRVGGGNTCGDDEGGWDLYIRRPSSERRDPMDDTRLKMLKYRANHRGFREADIIVGGFAQAHLHELSPVQVDAFERLVDQEDQYLYAWIIGREPTPAEFEGEVMEMVRAFHLLAYTTIGAHRGA
jgi:antitoxin CptB